MSLYNILVVDDEMFVADWLGKLLENQLNYPVDVYTAYDPEKALETIQRIRIDLLISDICMPTLTGFDLIARTRTYWPLCKYILLTAYADFDYAQKALDAHIECYILKTETDENILSSVSNTLARIETEMGEQKAFSDLKKASANSVSQLHTYVFNQLLKGNYLGSAESKKFLRLLGFRTEDACYSVIVATPGNDSGALCPEALSETLQNLQIKNLIEHFIEPYYEQMYANTIDGHIVWLLTTGSRFTEHFISLITGALELAQQTCHRTGSAAIGFAVGAPTSDPSAINSSYSIARHIISTRAADNYILSYDATNYPAKCPESAKCSCGTEHVPNRSTTLSGLKKYLDRNDKENFFPLLDTLCVYLRGAFLLQDNDALEIYYSLALTLLSHANRKNLKLEPSDQTDLQALFKPWLAGSFDMIETRIRHLADIFFSMHEERQKKDATRIIDDVISYIDAHINEDISLIDLAELTGYSTSYLSKFFSDNCRITISDYIAKQKIGRIRELMTDTGLTIGDIASRTGFHSRPYFNSYFKRNTGVAPQQYRDQLLSSASDTRQA